MPPVQFIVNHGKQILLMDFTNVKTNAEIAQTAEDAKKTVALQQPSSLLALVDFKGTHINKERIRIIQGMAIHNRPYIRFIALVGLGFFRAIGFMVMLRLTGRKNHRVFRTRGRALEWLARV